MPNPLKISSLDSFQESGKPVRYHHLDSLRSFLMIFGIFIHTGTLATASAFDAIHYVSGLVRMEAFFILSGFVTALIFLRHGAIKTIKKRLLTIAVPLFFGLVFINPIALYLVYIHHNDFVSLAYYLSHIQDIDGAGPGVWHLQLWFLIPLVLYSLVTPIVVVAFLRLKKLSAKRVKNFIGRYSFIVVVIFVMVGCSLARIVHFSLLKDVLIDTGLSFIVREALYNAPFFVVGVAMFISNYLREEFQKFNWFFLFLCIFFLFAGEFIIESQDGVFSKLVIILVRAFVAISLANFLFFIANKFLSKTNKIVRYFSDASYSIYILHYIVIYIYAFLLWNIINQKYVAFMIISMLSLLTTTLLHHKVIVKISILKFLLNGKTS